MRSSILINKLYQYHCLHTFKILVSAGTPEIDTEVAFIFILFDHRISVMVVCLFEPLLQTISYESMITTLLPHIFILCKQMKLFRWILLTAAGCLAVYAFPLKGR